ncbi:MAG: tyrosine-type recombinase/integrase [Terriglobales bacterium]
MSTNFVQLPLLSGETRSTPPVTEKVGSSQPINSVGNRRGMAKKFRPEGPCEAPGCTNVVPAGLVPIHQKHRYCSDKCKHKVQSQLHVIGVCEWCRGDIRGQKQRIGIAKHCSDKCEQEHNAERILGPTGPFRPAIEEFLATSNLSKDHLMGSVRNALSRLFTFAVNDGLTELGQITPRTVTRFAAFSRDHGHNAARDISNMVTFFRTLEAEGEIERNPIIPRIHSQAHNGPPRDPYSEDEMSALWKVLEEVGDVLLLLAFAIGEECGLRISEVCNIRLEDVNLERQEIFVRLPTKNGQTRTVPFHNKVKKLLPLWLAQRDPRCNHDHLLHGKQLRPLYTERLEDIFKKALCAYPEPATSFIFHRLRHTWATRLVNAGMELPVLQLLGGWKSLSSVQIYAKVRKETKDRQYEAACAVIDAKQEAPEEKSLSLRDFARIHAAASASRS